MATTLAHRGICVSNIERALRFYAGALGFVPTNEGVADAHVLGLLTGTPEPRLATAQLRNESGVTLELVQFNKPTACGVAQRRPLNKYGLTHFCFWTPNIEASAALLESCGGTPHWHTLVDFKPMSARVMYCSDPDGVRIEFGERADGPFAFLHSGICTLDSGRTADFYTRVLAFEQIEQFDLADHATWLGPLMELPGVRLSVRVLAGSGGERIELLQCHAPASFGSRSGEKPNRLGLSHTTFSVPSVEAAKAQLDALSRPWNDCGEGCLASTDPDGATIVLLERAA
jgi:catechol 2,3-dioxygenase-like lactoylglutathione lyase family enzyme